jgi:hypothetical protein
MAITRINNNQISDASAGNVYVGVNASSKLQNYTITSQKIANNLTYGSDLTISGNLTVNGQTTTIDTTVTTIEDPVILLASNQTGSPTVDIGFIGERGTSNNIAFVWDESSSEFVTVYTTDSETNTTVSISSYANFHTNDANVSGNLSVGGNIDITGNITSLTVTGNITGGNLLSPGVVSATGNVSGGNVTTAGQVAATGNVSGGNLTTLGITSTGSLTASTTISATGNVSGGNVTTAGNVSGGNLVSAGDVATTTVTATANVAGGNITTAGQVVATGNVSGGNLSAGSGIISTTGNVNGGNVNATAGITAGTTVSATGNVSGGNITTAGQVVATGNITGGNLITSGTFESASISATGNITGGNLITTGLTSTGSLTASTTVSATGNVSGGNLTTSGITSTNSLTASTTVSATGNVSGGNVTTAGQVVATGNVSGGNLTTAGQVTATGNVTGGNVNTAGLTQTNTLNVTAGANVGTTLGVTGNITGGNISAGSGIISTTGNINGGNLNATSGVTASTVTASGNISGGNISTAGSLSVATLETTGNALIGGNLIVQGNISYINIDDLRVEDPIIILGTGPNGAPLTADDGLDRGIFMEYYKTGLGNAFMGWDNSSGNMVIASSVNFTANDVVGVNSYGTLQAGNLYIQSAVSTGNVSGGNLTTAGQVVATGNITGGNVSAGSGIISTTGNINGGNLNATTGVRAATGYFTGNVDVLGNLNATVGVVYANSGIFLGDAVTGNNAAFAGVPGFTQLGSNVVMQFAGNVNSYSQLNFENINNGTQASTDFILTADNGNDGSNFFNMGITGSNWDGTQPNSLGNALRPNDGYLYADSGNVIIGTTVPNDHVRIIVGGDNNNFVVAEFHDPNTNAVSTTTGTLTITGGIGATGNIYGANIYTPGLVSATGNVSGGNVTTAGLISAGTTITATGNVAGGNLTTAGQVTATGNINGAGAVFSGNVTAANFIGNISGNIDAGGANTNIQFNDGDILAGSAAFTFDKTSNAVVATGNITGGNIGTAGQVTATGNITGGNLVTAGLASVTGNVTGGNINTAGQVVATGNVNGGNIVATSLVTGANVTATSNVTGANIVGTTSVTGANIVISTSSIDSTAGRITINGADADVDFAVDGDTVANVFYVDAGTGTASFGTSAQTTNALVAFNTSTSILMPVGNTGQRPGTGVTGMLRFNSTTDSLEIYDNSQWTTVGVPSFTVIDDQQFSGNGSQVAFTINSNQTTNSCIVSINGVVQIPTIAYSVSGTTLTFTEAPEAGDIIDVRQITTTTTVTAISNSSGNAVVGVSDTTNDVSITGDLIPTGNVTQDLGSPTQRWRDGYFSGSSLILGNVVMKNVAGGNTIAFFGPDGTTPATIASSSVDTTQIANGTSSLAVIASGGNIRANVGGTTVQTISPGLVAITGDLSVTGNATLSGNILGDRIQNGTTTIDIQTPNGNANITVGGTSNVAVFTTTGANITGALGVTGNITGGNLSGTSIVGTLTTAAQTNITSVGTLGSLSVTANVAGGNLTTAGQVVATGNVSGGNLNVTGNIVDTAALEIITGSNGNITLSPNGNGVIVANKDIRNGQANGVGNIGATGGFFNTIFAKATSAQYADLAEKYVADAEYAPGTVVVFGGDKEVTVSTTDADRAVAGVVSTNPSYTMNAGLEAEHVATVALTGRVPCRVTGSVHKGDLMVSAGYGMARAEADPRVGTVIGKALENFEGTEGVIEVVVGRF